MSSEYDIRVERPFAVVQVRDGAGAVLREILPGVDAGVPEVTLWTPEFADRRSEAPRVPVKFLALMHGGDAPQVPGYLLLMPGDVAAAGVLDIDIGYPEDPEGGRRFSVTRSFYREPASHLLGVAVAVAAARLTGGPVVDEYLELTGERLADPEAIVARLRDPAAIGTFPEAAGQIGRHENHRRCP